MRRTNERSGADRHPMLAGIMCGVSFRFLSARSFALVGLSGLVGAIACFSQDGGITGPDSGGPVALEVEMDDFQFDERTDTIQVGETVLWENKDNVLHTVTADSGLAADGTPVHVPDSAEFFNSGLIPPDEEFRRTFNVPGRYDYFCIPHQGSGMFGTLIVEE